jgi:hypothetical protein
MGYRKSDNLPGCRFCAIRLFFSLGRQYHILIIGGEGRGELGMEKSLI